MVRLHRRLVRLIALKFLLVIFSFSIGQTGNGRGFTLSILVLVGFEVLTAVVMKCSTFWDITSNPLKFNWCFGGTSGLHFQGLEINQTRKKTWKHVLTTWSLHEFAFMLVSCLAYSSILKMEAKYSSETSVDFQGTTRCYIPKYRTLQIG
jgi:hypothetical protein